MWTDAPAAHLIRGWELYLNFGIYSNIQCDDLETHFWLHNGHLGLNIRSAQTGGWIQHLHESYDTWLQCKFKSTCIWGRKKAMSYKQVNKRYCPCWASELIFCDFNVSVSRLKENSLQRSCIITARLICKETVFPLRAKTWQSFHVVRVTKVLLWMCGCLFGLWYFIPLPLNCPALIWCYKTSQTFALPAICSSIDSFSGTT